MKSNYILRRVNSPFDDSGIFVRNVYMKKAVLFDCGRLGNIDNSELNDISHVFISHTHIDHFNGFDRFLRTALLSGNTITFFGPAGFINNVKGKLAGYTWNLIYDYDVTFIAVELTEKGIKGAEFAAKNGFKEEKLTLDRNILNINDGFSIDYDFLYHGINSIGYRLKEPKRISINKEKMEEYGFVKGPWIRILKDAILAERSNDIINVETKNGVQKFYLNDIASKLAEYPESQDITYITDTAPTFENYKKAVKLAKNSHILLIEAVFMNNDIIHAVEKKHLSIGLSKAVYKYSNSYYVSFGHFAPKYDRVRDVFFQELYDDLDMDRIIKMELHR
ncbi:MAG: ribonuclease Z [Mucispirillum sp.]|uniref:Ribonuclease Z n=1 Tax=Candidatus Mucispirillum faecigallinarum TaxID=2838699 RepID=A0A9D2KC97_9BACT|nr:ribonuclease Z [Mucispirillum sp.]HIZ89617.1 ribonuclease Z [Candidatus Mucispirillum faecigallinarum]